MNGSISADFEKPAIIQIATKIKKPNIAPKENGYKSFAGVSGILTDTFLSKDFDSPGIKTLLLSSLCLSKISDIYFPSCFYKIPQKVLRCVEQKSPYTSVTYQWRLLTNLLLHHLKSVFYNITE